MKKRNLTTVFSVDWEEETLRQGHHLVKADGPKRGSRRLLEVRACKLGHRRTEQVGAFGAVRDGASPSRQSGLNGR